MFHLVVKEQFLHYRKGDVITDAAEVARILASPHAHHVVKRLSPETPVASSAPTPAPAVEAN